MAQRVLHRHGLRARRLHVLLRAHEAGQEPGRAGREEVRAVELGRHLDVEVEPGPGRVGAPDVRDGAGEVAAQGQERPHRAVEQALAHLHRRHALRAGGLEAEHLAQAVERHELGLLRDAHRALALDVGVPPHGRDAGAGPADVAAQQEEVDQHPQRLGPVDVLREAHAVDADHGLGAGVERRHRAQGFSRQARGRLDLPPPRGPREGLHGLEARRVLVEEGAVHDAALLPVHLQDALDEAEERRDVAAGPDLEVGLRDLGRGARGHLERALRILEPHEPRLAHGVERHDAAAAAHGVLQGVEEARAVRAGVLAEEQDHVAVLEVVERAGADGRADDLLERHRGRLVTHVGPRSGRSRGRSAAGASGGPAPPGRGRTSPSAP